MNATPLGPISTADLLIGDQIQARRFSADEPFESAEGIVSALGATIVTMGTREFDSATGWEFEVIFRDLNFPTSLCEIDVVLGTTGETLRLIGRGEVWRDQSGILVPLEGIRSWELVA